MHFSKDRKEVPAKEIRRSAPLIDTDAIPKVAPEEKIKPAKLSLLACNETGWLWESSLGQLTSKLTHRLRCFAGFI
jgi:hypothetical protein